MHTSDGGAPAADGGCVVALVPAAGHGVRLGESRPKAFVEVGGTAMVGHAVRGLIASRAVARVVVVVPGALVDTAAAVLPVSGGSSDDIEVSVVTGGAERVDSVRAGIDAAPEADYFLVHDAARALTPPALIARVVADLRAGYRAVVPALPVVDTIKSVDGEGVVTGTPDRAALRAIQTPQGFHADLLRRAHDGSDGSTVTDDAGLVELLGVPVHTVPGDPLAFKITTPLDLRLARALLADSDAAANQATPEVVST